MKRLSLLFTILLTSLGLYAQSVDSLWSEANGLYASGKFKEASSMYENIINDGSESAHLYYNLANAYYKQNMLGKAILNYERASKLAPSDEDIAFNLEFVKAQTLDKIDPLPTTFIAKAVQSVTRVFSIDGWAILAVVLFVVGLLFILMAYFFVHRLAFRRMYFWAGILTVVLCITSVSIASSMARVHEAIVMSPVSTIKSSPDASGKELFILHEGTKVRILDELSGWRKVKIANGNQGWVELKDIEQI